MKILFRWLLIGVLVFGFVGCGGGGGTTPDTPKVEENTTTPKVEKFPVFQNSATVTVAENQTTAITINATDVDSPTLTYSISGTDYTSFDIDSTTGVVTFKTAPNYEVKNSYSFIATASDGVNEANQSVTIDISDVVDTVAVLASDINISVVESISLSTVLGNIIISDEGDTPISSFEVNGSGAEKFAIATNGEITLVEVLDYEMTTEYNLTLTAINDAGRSNSISLNISVLNADLEIVLAVYDNNKTTDPTDDTLRVYFSKDIDENSRNDNAVANYGVEGEGDIDGGIGVYSVAHREDRISLSSSTQAFVPYESNLSVLLDTITDTNSTNADANPQRLISAYAIKKTEQNLSYESNGTIHTAGTQKDDGYYQSGQTPHYSRDDTKEVVLDHITGLMWADDANVSTLTKPWVTTANYNAGNYSDTSGDTASTYCSDLTLGGYSDWRLPSVKELLFIVDNSKYSPSIDNQFQNTISNLYWSSTTYASGVDFYSGYTDYDGKDNSNYVRCVRAGQ